MDVIATLEFYVKDVCDVSDLMEYEGSLEEKMFSLLSDMLEDVPITSFPIVYESLVGVKPVVKEREEKDCLKTHVKKLRELLSTEYSICRTDKTDMAFSESLILGEVLSNIDKCLGEI